MVIAVEDYSNDKTGIIGENKESTQVVGDVETGIEGQEEGELGVGVPAGVEAVYRWRLQQEHRMRDSDKPSLTDEQVGSFLILTYIHNLYKNEVYEKCA